MWPQKELEITTKGELNTDVKLKKRVYAGDEDNEQEGYVFRLGFDDREKVRMVYLPEQTPEIEPHQLPGWLRKEKKRDKQLWGQLKHYCKTLTVYEEPLFDPIPEVKRYVPPSEQNESKE